MEQNNKNNGFRYTYSAREQAEIRRIRDKYTDGAPEEDKLARLRRLDARVTAKAQCVALCLGVVGSLILGTGMSLCMTDLSEILGPHRNIAIALGILIGVIGGVLAAMAYPMYNRITEKEKKRVAPEILRLTEELMK